MWPLIASLYAEQGIVLCVRNIAINGSSMNAWQKGGANYTAINDFYVAAGGIEFTTGVIGESDAGAGMTTVTMEGLMNQFVDDLNADFGTTHYITYFPEGDGGLFTPAEADVIRLAYDNVISAKSYARFGGDLRVVDIDISTGAGNDGTHIRQDDVLLEAANIRYLSFNSTSLNITTTSVPDGSYDAVLWDESRVIVYNGVLSVAGDSLNISVNTPTVGETIRGDAYDPLGADTDGMRLKGVTT
jgi:hypothetical protein